MTWGRRGRLLAVPVLVCLSIPLLGMQAAWADVVVGPASHLTVTPTPTYVAGSPQSIGHSVATGHPYEGLRVEYACAGANLSGLGSDATPGVAATFSTSVPACTAPYRLSIFRVRATTTAGATSANSTDTVVYAWIPNVNPDPSPSPYPVYLLPSAYPTDWPQPSTTHYAYPTPPAGGGSVGSCGGPEQDPCTIATVAGQGIELSEGQALPLFLFLGLLLMVALTTFLLRQGRALRV